MKRIESIISGSSIDFLVKQCQQINTIFDWVEIDVRFIESTQFPNRYTIEIYNIDGLENWLGIGFIAFDATLCNGIPPCNELTDVQFDYVRQEDLWQGVKACTSSVNQLAGFNTAIKYELPTNYSLELPSSCTNNDGLISFKFNLLKDGINTNEIPINYLLNFCDVIRTPPLPPLEYIENETHLQNQLNQGNLDNDICTLLGDACGHAGYDGAKIFKFVFRELVQNHEDAHLNNYKRAWDEWKDELIEKLNSWAIACQSITEQKRAEANNFFRNTMDVYRILARDSFDKDPDDTDIKINTLDSHLELVWQYYILIKEHILLERINCPWTAECDNLEKLFKKI